MVTMDDKERDAEIIFYPSERKNQLKNLLEIGYYVDIAIRMNDNQVLFVLIRDKKDWE